MSRLEFLSLNNTRVDGLEPIKHLSSLKFLSLDHTPIDDAGLAPASNLRGLNDLTLNATRVSNEGLAHLAGLPGLARRRTRILRQLHNPYLLSFLLEFRRTNQTFWNQAVRHRGSTTGRSLGKC